MTVMIGIVGTTENSMTSLCVRNVWPGHHADSIVFGTGGPNGDAGIAMQRRSFKHPHKEHMTKITFRRLLSIATLSGCCLASAAGPVGGIYEIPSSTLNSGASDLAGGSYKLSSSVGGLAYATALSGSPYQFYPGFWNTVTGLPGCLLDIDGNGRWTP